VRSVLEVIPVTMFDVLARLTALQGNTLEPLPIKIDLSELGRAAAPELRFRLAKMTHWWVATLAQGVLLISKTLLRVVEVDPRQVLETGVRSELHGLTFFPTPSPVRSR
jgi:WASH complex subunit strumpellin